MWPLGSLFFRHICSETNFSDICTKPLPNDSFHNICRPTLFRSPLTEPLVPLPIESTIPKALDGEGNRENGEVIETEECN